MEYDKKDILYFCFSRRLDAKRQEEARRQEKTRWVSNQENDWFHY